MVSMNELDQNETKGVLGRPFFVARTQPTPIPATAWNDDPLFCLKINDQWVSHVIGVLTALDQPDTWLGTPEEVYAARQQVNEVILALMTACEDCAIEFRIVDCDLQFRSNPEDDWTSLGNVCGSNGADGANGTDGVDGADGTNGTDGTNGADGTNGTNGTDGTDCDCTVFNHVPTPENPPDHTDDQTSCNVSAGMSDYIKSKLVLTITTSETETHLALAIAAVVASIIAAVVTGGAAYPIVVAAVSVLINVIITADSGQRDAMIADASFWNSMTCSIYCVIRPSKDIDETLKASISTAIRATTYTSGSYDAPYWYGVAADFWDGLPLEVIRANVSIGALIDYDCSGCDCPSEFIDVFIGDDGGTFVSRVSEVLTATAVAGGPSNYVLYLQFGSVDYPPNVDTCGLMNFTVTDGTVDAALATVAVCGTSTQTGITYVAVPTTCVNQLVLVSTVIFTIDVFGNPCP
jgi:hypothetical protein